MPGKLMKEIPKPTLERLSKDEKEASKEYAGIAKDYPQHERVFKGMSKDEGRHFKNITKIQEHNKK
jgi:hypothetical protein